MSRDTVKRFMGGLVGVLVVSVIILSRTDWGSRQIGGTVAGWFSGNGTSPARTLVFQSRILQAHTDYLNSLFVLPKNIFIDAFNQNFGPHLKR